MVKQRDEADYKPKEAEQRGDEGELVRPGQALLEGIEGSGGRRRVAWGGGWGGGGGLGARDDGGGEERRVGDADGERQAGLDPAAAAQEVEIAAVARQLDGPHLLREE